MKLRPFSLPVLKAAKTSTMFLLTPMLCFKACSVFQEDWFSACCLLILWSVYILQEEGERWFWSSWFDTFENESDIEADHKNKSSRTFRALLCFVYLQTCGKVLRPIKSQKKKKKIPQDTIVASAEITIVEMHLKNQPVFSVSSKWLLLSYGRFLCLYCNSSVPTPAGQAGSLSTLKMKDPDLLGCSITSGTLLNQAVKLD